MNTKINCLIIDDEPYAQEIIEKHAEKVPYLHILKKSNNAIEGLKDIQELRPDLVFMDIQMPEMTGLELIRILHNHKPYIIITTASPDHALEGFDLEVTDYLLKPISFDRFLKAVNKIYGYISISREKINITAEEKTKNSHFWVKENGKMVHLSVDDVLMVKGLKDYIQIFLKERKIITYQTMKRIMEILQEDDFMRVSRSYIVRKTAIKAINGNILETTVGEEEVMIGSTYRETIKNEINEWLR